MIRINLLPVHMRKREATPLPRLLAIYGGTALCAVLICWWVGIRFSLSRDRNVLKDLENAATQKERQVAQEYEPREAELDAIRDQRNLVEMLESRRIRWAPRLDAIWDAVGEDPELAMAGIQYIEIGIPMEMGGGRRGRRGKKPKELVVGQLSFVFWSTHFAEEPDFEAMLAKDRITRLASRMQSRLVQIQDEAPPMDVFPSRWWTETVEDLENERLKDYFNARYPDQRFLWFQIDLRYQHYQREARG